MAFTDPKAAAIRAVMNATCAYTKYITQNDTNIRSHQSGYYLHKDAWKLFFDEPFKKGQNIDKLAQITWQSEFTTQSRVVYYGAKKNEYRLTRFQKDFPFRSDDCIGDLLIICRMANDDYQAFVLESDDDINDFFAAFNISPADADGMIDQGDETHGPEAAMMRCFQTFLSSVRREFPGTEAMAKQARECCRVAGVVQTGSAKKSPDEVLMKWLDAEYQLFKLIENEYYSERIVSPFQSVEDLIDTASSLLNRRKSRAGKSLEHHLSAIFQEFQLAFETQKSTEGKKKPDFIFPGSDAYRNKNFDNRNLFVLAAKTTCKDRWRQVVTEANRVTTKYLFTLQDGISENQLNEMFESNVRLIVPRANLKSFPENFRSQILTLGQFVDIVLKSQKSI